MNRTLLIAIAALSGAGLATQASMNTQMREFLGSAIAASVINFSIGLLFLLIILISLEGVQVLGNVGSVPSWNLAGGVLGALFVLIAAYSARGLGLGFFLCLVISGQLFFAVIIDHFGWFGIPKEPISLSRILGVLLLICGSWLMKSR